MKLLLIPISIFNYKSNSLWMLCEPERRVIYIFLSLISQFPGVVCYGNQASSDIKDIVSFMNHEIPEHSSIDCY